MKLKPCPFCGSTNIEFIDIPESGANWYECGNCGTTCKEYQWNTRTSGWISVDERLPEVDKPVMLYSSDDGMCIGHRMRYIKKGYGYVESSDLNAVGGVTHWMPRPDSPDSPETEGE
jgi:transcription elongation factor Elf1